MNKVFRVVWNSTLGCWQVAGELVRNKTKSGSASLLVVAGLLAPNGAFAGVADNALPSGGVVASGAAAVQQANAQMVIQQSSQNLVMDWQSFDIGANASVKFEQPNVNAAALNRIHSSHPSEILGQLQANGQVVLADSHGFVFGANAAINVNSLVASTLAISEQGFLDGSIHAQAASATTASPNGSISTAADIKAAGGMVALIAPSIANTGNIETNGGQIALLAGNKVRIDCNPPIISIS